MRILIIDDNPYDAELTQRALRNIAGIEFDYVEDFKSLKKIFAVDKYSTVISDYALQGCLGTDVLEYVKKLEPDIPFIIISGTIGEEAVVEVLRLGATDYVLKDNIGKLPLAVVRALEEADSKKAKQLAILQLKENEEKYRLLSETLQITNELLTKKEKSLKEAQAIALIGNWEIDLSNNQHTWSDELYIIFGARRSEVPSVEFFLSFIHPEDKGFVAGKVEESFIHFTNSSFDFRFISMDGSLHYAYSEYVFEFNEHKKPIRLYGIIQDITEKTLASQEKEFDQKNLSALINNTSDLMWSVDRSFKLITSNKAFEDIVLLISGKKIAKGSNILIPEFEEEQLTLYKGFYEKAFFGEAFTTISCYNSTWSEKSFYPIVNGSEIIGTACYSKDITERKIKEEEILQKNERLRYLTSHLQYIREFERTTIAREIHDELGQQLTALKMEIGWILHKQNKKEKAIVTKLNDMLSMSDGIINTIRRISSDLRPAIIDDLGLIAALEWKCNDFEEKMGIPCKFTSSVHERKFENSFGINVFRILQETLTNVSRHANAKSVSVSVSENEAELFLEISDNGKGIDNEKIAKGKTLGILGMKERAVLLGGSLNIEGIKNNGTTTKLIIPFKNEDTNS